MSRGAILRFHSGRSVVKVTLAGQGVQLWLSKTFCKNLKFTKRYNCINMYFDSYLLFEIEIFTELLHPFDFNCQCNQLFVPKNLFDDKT